MFDRKAYMKEYNREYNQKHREKKNVWQRGWRQKNPEKVKEYNRKYRERCRKWLKEWRWKNPIKVREYYKRRDKRKQAEYVGKWEQNHHEKVKDFKRQHIENIRFNGEKLKVLERDKTCVVCGSRSKLCIHHIDLDNHNNCLENLVLLCSGCHQRLHRFTESFCVRKSPKAHLYEAFEIFRNKPFKLLERGDTRPRKWSEVAVAKPTIQRKGQVDRRPMAM